MVVCVSQLYRVVLILPQLSSVISLLISTHRFCSQTTAHKLENPKLETGELWETGVILLSVGFFVLVFVTCMGLCILHKRKGFVRNKETAVGMLEHPHEPVLRNPPAFLGDEHPRDGADQSGGPPDERGEVHKFLTGAHSIGLFKIKKCGSISRWRVF